VSETTRLSAESLPALKAITRLKYRSQAISDRADLERILPALFTASPHQHAYVGAIDAVPLEISTETGVYTLDLVNVKSGRAGIAAGDGVVFHTLAQLADLLADALTRATSESESSDAPAGGAASPPPRLSVPPAGNAVRVIFYALDHNAVFAEGLRQQDPDHTITAPLGPGSNPQYCANVLAGIYGANPIGQVIFASHGAAAVFQAGPIPAGPDALTNVGLYPHNVQPDAFGQMIAPLLRENATITLLTCSTIATAQGDQFMQSLAAASGAWVIGCDDTVIIYTGLVSNATTTGNIWRCQSGHGPVILNQNPNPGVTEIAVPLAPVVPLYAIAALAAA
jgi:hypothetical protein